MIQENVVSFPLGSIMMFLGDMCAAEEITFNSTDFGWPGSRRRKYVILRHIVKTGPASVPLNTISRALLRTRRVTWRDAFVAGVLGISEDVEAAIERKVKRDKPWEDSVPDDARGAERKILIQNAKANACASVRNAFSIDDPSCFETFLTPSELSFLEGYRVKFPNRAWSLNQNPGRSLGFMTWRYRLFRLRCSDRLSIYIVNPFFCALTRWLEQSACRRSSLHDPIRWYDWL